jgi:hypothetical protein
VLVRFFYLQDRQKSRIANVQARFPSMLSSQSQIIANSTFAAEAEMGGNRLELLTSAV